MIKMSDNNLENHTFELLRAIRNDIAILKSDMHHGFADTNLRISAIEDMLQADFTSRLAHAINLQNWLSAFIAWKNKPTSTNKFRSHQ